MKLKLKFKGKELLLDLKEMRGINKFLGLIIYRKTNLIFEFKEGRRAIHSLFCPSFFVIWLNNGKVVDIRMIKPWKLSIRPEKEFDKLIEVPISISNYKIVNYLLKFIDDKRKV